MTEGGIDEATFRARYAEASMALDEAGMGMEDLRFVEEMDSDGRPRWDVYVGETFQGSLVPPEEPGAAWRVLAY